MKVDLWLTAILVFSVSACSSPQKKKERPAPTTPAYQSAADLFKSDHCSKRVESSHGDQPLTLKPSYKVLNEDADIFCIQKLQKNRKILKVTSALGPWSAQETFKTEVRFFATVFDLAVYDQTMTKLSMHEPHYQLQDQTALSAYYDFSKYKKLPAYLVILFQRENREKVIFSKTEASPKGTPHAGTTAFALGGLMAGAVVSTQSVPVKLNVYPGNPEVLRAEWVQSIPRP